MTMTLGMWLNEWLSLYVYPAGLAKSTQMMYTGAVRKYPADLTAIPLEELSALDLRRWLLLRAESDPRAAQIAHLTLTRALRVAAKLGLCDPLIIDADVLPPIKHKAAKAAILTHEQLQHYYHAAADTDVAPALMLMCCGLRRGEAMGARWEWLDLSAGTMRVEGQRLTCDQVEATPLKTSASLRVIALPAALQATLRAWPRDDAPWLVGCGYHKLYARHRQLLDALRLPSDVTLHGLRHSFATAAAVSGVPIKVLQAALGHAKYNLTADLYADHLPSVTLVSTRLFAS